MGNQNGNGNDVRRLFEAAEEEGSLSPEAMQALAAMDIGAQIQAGLGVGVDDVSASEVVLMTIMPDDSASIRFGGNADSVREGHNLCVDALAASKQKDSILGHTRYLNGHVLYPYRPVALAEKMTRKNYNPDLGTPLYDQTIVLLGTVIAKTQEFAQSGVPVRSVTLIITDGADAGSLKAKPNDVRAIVRDMLSSEQHIVAAMGIDDGQTPFRDVFRAMGIEDRWILTPKSDAGEIRKAFRMFSQSAMRASQHAGAFSRAAAGGFLG